MCDQRDIESGGNFDDIVAYGGWPMDDHNPGGFYAKAGEPASLLYPTPSPYGIPYRVLYSKNIANLFFAGRNISATHAALSSTRVMATCSLLGQAVGTAAGICVAENATPHEIYEKHIKKLQKKLIDAGCWLPGMTREIPALSVRAKLNLSDAERSVLFNGVERDIPGEKNHITLPTGGQIRFSFDSPEFVARLRVVFDPFLAPLGLIKQKCAHSPEILHRSYRPVKVATLKVLWYGETSLFTRQTTGTTRYSYLMCAKTAELGRFPAPGAPNVNIFSCDVE